MSLSQPDLMHAGRGSVLLVEDNMTDVHAVLRRFRGGPLGVRHVRTGAAALDLVARERFAAVLMDHRLPDVPGTKVCRLMREAGIDVPIFMFSAISDDALGDAALAAGATAYLVKDIAMPNLDSFVAQHLPAV